jgi:UDP-sugar transporter A1/2/3
MASKAGYEKVAPDAADFEEEDQPPTTSANPEKDALIIDERHQGQAKPSRFLQLTLLVAVMLQNTSYALLRRYSRAELKETYSSSSALLTMELVKLVLSMQQVAYGGHPSDVPDSSAVRKYVWLLCHSWKMLVPAAIYLIMNILGFLALAHLDAATFSIVAQMKIFTTAFFSVLILGRDLHLRKWRALTTLVLGVILISHEAMPKSANGPPSVARSSFFIGMAAAFGDVLLSGFVSIYFEMVKANPHPNPNPNPKPIYFEMVKANPNPNPSTLRW